MADPKTPQTAENLPAIPEYFEGKRTRYDMMDGFRHLSIPGRALYVVAGLGSGGILPAAYEYVQYRGSQHAEKEARKVFLKEAFLSSFLKHANSKDESPEPVTLSDMSPGDRFRKLVETKKEHESVHELSL